MRGKCGNGEGKNRGDYLNKDIARDKESRKEREENELAGKSIDDPNTHWIWISQGPWQIFQCRVEVDFERGVRPRHSWTRRIWPI